jgi:hypothetical protein
VIQARDRNSDDHRLIRGAGIVFQYELGREAKLRQARDWFTKNYFVNNIDDAMRIAPMGTTRFQVASQLCLRHFFLPI